jgi:hypothetical protein
MLVDSTTGNIYPTFGIHQNPGSNCYHSHVINPTGRRSGTIFGIDPHISVAEIGGPDRLAVAAATQPDTNFYIFSLHRIDASLLSVIG